MGFRSVQLSAAQPGLRPRELDRSGRRDLLARLRRLQLPAAGLDLWIPAAHFTDPARVDRAVATVAAAIELAGDLGRCPVCMVLPGEDARPLVAAIAELALRHGVRVADHAVPQEAGGTNPSIGAGIDPAMWLNRDEDPVAAVAEYARDLVSVRLADDPRFDEAAFGEALMACAYRGPVVVDLRDSADAWRRLAEFT
jgi:sugar phosphate isomerase/epimerase